MIKTMLEDKKQFIPKAGFNVVGVDDFEDPGEQLYLIGHFVTRPMAEARKKLFKKQNPGESVFIYDPSTR